MVKPFQPLYSPDEGGGAGGGSGSEGKEGAAKASGETVSKSDYDKVVGDLEKLKQDLEDTRLEVMTPEYLEFLNTKSKGSGAKDKSSETSPADQFKGLTPQQIYDRAVDDAKKAAKEEADRLREEFSTSSRENIQKEIAAFARTHADYDQFRPLMYGISLDPKFKDSTLQELYDEAKAVVKRLHTEPTDEQKRKSRASGGEKPGSGSGTVVKDKKYTPEEAAAEAWNETVGPEGLPSA